MKHQRITSTTQGKYSSKHNENVVRGTKSMKYELNRAVVEDGEVNIPKTAVILGMVSDPPTGTAKPGELQEWTTYIYYLMPMKFRALIRPNRKR